MIARGGYRPIVAAYLVLFLCAIGTSLADVARDIESVGEYLDDETIETILREGEVLEIEEIGTGVTRPKRVLLQHNGRNRYAAFKTYDVCKQGITHLKGGVEINFTDRYQYEVAAYRIDRFLALGQVPVAVIRSINGETGVLVDWVEDAITGKELKDRELETRDRLTYIKQHTLMILFDALIGNTDRNLCNRLITPHDWKLYLIDHTRAFRTVSKLPDRYVHGLDPIPKSIYDRLVRLDFKKLYDLTGDVLNRAEVKAVLKRRDRIIGKIDKDLLRYGSQVVFLPD
jgi:hypothetical protein